MEVYNYEDIVFVNKEAKIYDKDNNLIFNELIEFPDFYDDNSVNIISSKYLCNSDKVKETSLKQIINRISDTITEWGWEQNYFDTEDEKIKFNNVLKYYQIHQYFAFNSPVYFNLGLRPDPQISACFILNIEDNMDSITDCIKTEAKIFKQGSGSGINLSTLRSSKEQISAGGKASGPVSFLKVMDVNASVIKSGGTLRRSAKMAILNISHPDIEEFIICKKDEEKKLKALIDAGITPKPGCELADEVFFQNTNISVRITNEFMEAVEKDKPFWTKLVNNGENYKEYNARELLLKIAENAWLYADPGIQYHDTVNDWHTCKQDGEITSSNPCGEYIFLNDSSCNLASLNVLKFYKNNKFNIDKYCKVINMIITAQDIIINKAYYPTEKIKQNSIAYRPLGLGYTNLGALLMCMGYAYDSDEGRNIASGITSVLTGQAYLTSSQLANKLGEFSEFKRNKKDMLNIIKKHYDYVIVNRDNMYHQKFHNNNIQEINNIWSISNNIWNKVIKANKFRNAQTTLIAPTGSISFFMGATTTGMEPEFSHTKYKRLSNSDGAIISLINPLIEISLKNLNYSNEDISNITNDILLNKPFNEIKLLKDEHKSIFYTTMSTPNISPDGHLKMMGAIQPFISGALSKTINLPNNCTINDIYNIYLNGWKLGLKGLTVYRDGSKNFQPLSATKKEEKSNYNKELDIPGRKKLPDERPAINHKFVINNNFKGYLSCGLYDDGSLGEIFIDVAKEGSTISGILKSLAVVTSISLQRGVPLKELVTKLSYQRFEPNGFTNFKDVKICHSVVDYIFRYLGYKFLSEEDKIELGLVSIDNSNIKNIEKIAHDVSSGTPCENCGSIMVRLGKCWLCKNCGNNNGSCS